MAVFEFKPGDVILTHGTKLIHKLIRYKTGGFYNHAAIFLGPEDRVGEATFPKMRFNTMSNLAKDGEFCVMRINPAIVGLVENVLLEKALLSMIRDCEAGVKYDVRAILGFALNRNMEKGSEWFCSERAWKFWSDAGKKVTNSQPWRFSPDDIFDSIAFTMVYDSNPATS